MNFLSHFYFDRDSTNGYHTLGTVLPDLLKNADKTINLHPEKLQHPNPDVNDMITGWQKHLEVDKYFHSSSFFVERSHHLKKLLMPALGGSPAKPFFLGHIAIELILDNLLITTGKISVDAFYKHLNKCNLDIVSEFLRFAGLRDTDAFILFYEKFKKSRYLESYIETQQIAYALKRICMRVWDNPFTPEQEEKITTILSAYRQAIKPDFMSIFVEIGQKLENGA